MNKSFKIAIAGLGTVGAGLVRLLNKNRVPISLRCGREIQVIGVSARDPDRDRGIDTSDFDWFDDPVRMACLLYTSDAADE